MTRVDDHSRPSTTGDRCGATVTGVGIRCDLQSGLSPPWSRGCGGSEPDGSRRLVCGSRKMVVSVGQAREAPRRSQSGPFGCASQYTFCKAAGSRKQSYQYLSAAPVTGAEQPAKTPPAGQSSGASARRSTALKPGKTGGKTFRTSAAGQEKPRTPPSAPRITIATRAFPSTVW